MNVKQYLETGLTTLDAFLRQIVPKIRQHHDENVVSGLVSDEDKLKYLKAELFRRVRDNKPIDDTTKAIALLLEIQTLKDSRNNSPGVQIDNLIVSTFWLGIAVTTLSFAATWSCGSSQSPFCQRARIIPNIIVRQFQEPTKPKSLLPEKPH